MEHEEGPWPCNSPPSLMSDNPGYFTFAFHDGGKHVLACF